MLTNWLRASVAHRSFNAIVRRPGFALVAVLFMGLGIGLNTTMFSALDALINPRLDIREPGQLYSVSIMEYRSERLQSATMYSWLRNATHLQQGVTSYRMAYGGSYLPAIVEAGAAIQEARVATVAPNFFAVLGVHASRGRLLFEGDLQASLPAAVIGERFARQLFPTLDSPLGQHIRIDGDAFAIVGVLPREGDFPPGYTDLWVLPPANLVAGMPLNLMRVREGATPVLAHRELQSLATRLEVEAGLTPQTVVRIDPAVYRQFRYRSFHYALIAAVFAVLLIACANLANLQLARGISRSRELATRTALGASRADIVKQLLMESAWLALGGLLVGSIFAMWGMHILAATIPPSVGEYIVAPQLTWRVVAFAVAVSLFCIVAIGLVPALRVSRVDPNELLKAGAGTGNTRAGRRQWGTLVAVEVGLALALFCGATLLARAAKALHSDALTAHQPVAAGIFRYPPLVGEPVPATETMQNLVHTLQRDSVVQLAAVARWAGYEGDRLTFMQPGGALMERIVPRGAGYSIVTPRFFRTMAVRPVLGRDFTQSESGAAEAIVTEATARRLWPGANPLGQQIQLGSRSSGAPWLTVVGVIPEVLGLTQSLSAGVQARVRPPDTGLQGTASLAPIDTEFLRGITVFALASNTPAVVPTGGFAARVFVRARGADTRLLASLKRAFAGGTEAKLLLAGNWDQWTGIERERTSRDFVAALFTAFAVIALALASFGIFATVAHSVAQRTREFGVRIALGAAQSDVLKMVLRESNVLAMTGIAVGLLFTMWSASLLRTFLWFEDDPNDAPLFALVALVLFAVVTVASLVPALRATRVDPVEALRND